MLLEVLVGGARAEVVVADHEAAGAALAKKWNLAAEIAAVAGNHERVETVRGTGYRFRGA